MQHAQQWCIQELGGGQQGKDHLQGLGVDGEIMLTGLCDLAEGRDRCWAPVNMVVNFRVP